MTKVNYIRDKYFPHFRARNKTIIHDDIHWNREIIFFIEFNDYKRKSLLFLFNHIFYRVFFTTIVNFLARWLVKNRRE